jgi:hypothetical protein
MKDILLALLIIPGLVAGYALILRPLLHKIPAFANFYARADGFWQTAWALCGNSLTVAWGYLLGGVGAALGMLQPIASLLGDPNLQGQVTDTLKSSPQVLGWVMFGISFITIMARIRSILKDG